MSDQMDDMKPEASHQAEPFVVPKSSTAIVAMEDGLKLITPSMSRDLTLEAVLLVAAFHRMHHEEGFAQSCYDYFTENPEYASYYGIEMERIDGPPLQ
jgi:hypothetical protein